MPETIEQHIADRLQAAYDERMAEAMTVWTDLVHAHGITEGERLFSEWMDERYPQPNEGAPE